LHACVEPLSSPCGEAISVRADISATTHLLDSVSDDSLLDAASVATETLTESRRRITHTENSGGFPVFGMTSNLRRITRPASTAAAFTRAMAKLVSQTTNRDAGLASRDAADWQYASTPPTKLEQTRGGFLVRWERAFSHWKIGWCACTTLREVQQPNNPCKKGASQGMHDEHS
jgi:hypothetical protein